MNRKLYGYHIGDILRVYLPDAGNTRIGFVYWDTESKEHRLFMGIDPKNRMHTISLSYAVNCGEIAKLGTTDDEGLWEQVCMYPKRARTLPAPDVPAVKNGWWKLTIDVEVDHTGILFEELPKQTQNEIMHLIYQGCVAGNIELKVAKEDVKN